MKLAQIHILIFHHNLVRVCFLIPSAFVHNPEEKISTNFPKIRMCEIIQYVCK